MKNKKEKGFVELDASAFFKKQDQPMENPDFKVKKNLLAIEIAVIVGLLCACLIVGMNTLDVGAKAVADTFAAAKDETKTEVYDAFYQRSFNAAEEQYHVSNRISIQIEDIREQAKLEVLQVYDVAYEISESENQNLFDSARDFIKEGTLPGEVVSWLEVPASGRFIIDLQKSEFIVDDERQYVLIRVPKPELINYSIEYENIKVLHVSAKGATTAGQGEDKAREQIENAELSLRQEVLENQEIYKSAKSSAQKMLENWVKKLNPQVPDLLVEVEFID